MSPLIIYNINGSDNMTEEENNTLEEVEEIELPVRKTTKEMLDKKENKDSNNSK